jgi:hypothetical protein
MDETDFRKLAIATPFGFTEIKTAYDLKSGHFLQSEK